MPAPGDEVPLGIMDAVEARTRGRDQLLSRMSVGMRTDPEALDASAICTTIPPGGQVHQSKLLLAAGPGAVERALFPFTDIGGERPSISDPSSPSPRW